MYVSDLRDDEAIAEVCTGKNQLVCMSPESLLTDERWRDMLLSPVYQEHLVRDKAHCVKKWLVLLSSSIYL